MWLFCATESKQCQQKKCCTLLFVCYNRATQIEKLMKKPTKSATIRARCAPQLKDDLATVAKLKELDEADIVRIALACYIAPFKNAAAARMPELVNG